MASTTRVAVVDLGTNTTRLLVADVVDGQVEEVERRNTVTRLGEDVDAGGELIEPAMERVFAALAEYREAIDELGAERTVAVATSAVRDAANGDYFRNQLRERFGIDARIISGDEEARLTFAGATAERPDGAAPLLVLDIGGGSTEFVVGRSGEDPSFNVSTQAGSVRQTERHISTDPPAPSEIEGLTNDVRSVIEQSVPPAVRSGVKDGVAVAGTPTSLAAIDQRLDPYDPAKVHGYRLELGTCERILGMLASLPEPERRKVVGLHPDRAPTIIAGAVILVQSMRAFGLGTIAVGEHDILYGAAIWGAR
ncbi:MAG TPA: Ppx/GppA phosphatase family protein [Thermoleophilaceae bacterium]|jgi:exopolyphosphatase/guanosine-5'-triphosphate,3'-diphosphate pyrophosphatase